MASILWRQSVSLTLVACLCAAAVAQKIGACARANTRCGGHVGLLFTADLPCCGGLVCEWVPELGGGRWCVDMAQRRPLRLQQSLRQDCYSQNTRCQGAPNYPMVPWKPCCDSSAKCVENPSLGWGKFCTLGNSESSTCYVTNQRCEGAPGFPYVESKPCCSSGAQCVENSDLGWGKWCLESLLRQKGGDKNDGNVPTGWSILSASGSLTQRHEASFVKANNNKAYLVGGRGIQPVDILDLATNTWSSGASSPIELHHTQAVYLDGKIWVLAAWTGNYPNEQNVDSIYVYDIKDNKWSTKKHLPEKRRRGSAAAAVYQGKIVIAMGNRGGHGPQSTTLGWMDMYDPATDSWNSDFPDAPNARDHTGGAIINGKFCVAGGRDGSSADFSKSAIAPTNCYDFASGSWDTKASIPEPRSGSSYGLSCDGKLIVAGGEGSGKAFNRVDYFDGESWSSKPTYMSKARHGSGVVVGNCKCGNLYVASGSGAQGGSPELSSTEIYSPDGQVC